MYLLIVILFAFSLSTYALDNNESLTVRILKISSTKKTILINRGQEDAINIDDQVKFFLDNGVIARGVAVKVTPIRSIWSLYRVNNTNEILVDKIYKIKKTSSYKLTKDITKKLNDHDLNQKIPREKTHRFKDIDKQDLKHISFNKTKVKTIYSKKAIEFWGAVSFNSLSSTYNLSGASSGTGQTSASDYTIAMEKYFIKSKLLKNISLFAFIHKSDISAMSVTGQQINLSKFEYGAGATYHMFTSPFRLNKMMVYLNAAMAFGTSSDILNLSNSGTASALDSTLKGSVSSLSFGLGLKYLFRNNFSLRTQADFYSSNESFSPPTGVGTNYLKSTTGIRAMFAIGKRF